jgi:hypothetical protein
MQFAIVRIYPASTEAEAVKTEFDHVLIAGF